MEKEKVNAKPKHLNYPKICKHIYFIYNIKYINKYFLTRFQETIIDFYFLKKFIIFFTTYNE